MPGLNCQLWELWQSPPCENSPNRAGCIRTATVTGRCRANMAHMRQSRPYSRLAYFLALAFRSKSLNPVKKFPLRSEAVRAGSAPETYYDDSTPPVRGARNLASRLSHLETRWSRWPPPLFWQTNGPPSPTSKPGGLWCKFQILESESKGLGNSSCE